MPERQPLPSRPAPSSRRRFGRRTWTDLGLQSGALVLAFLLTSVILLVAGAPPFQAYVEIAKGAAASFTDISNVLVAWVPLLLASAGVLVTFAAGLWNIGVEGQIVLGAVLTTWVLRLLQDTSLPPAFIVVLAIIAGIVGGALWAALAGILKTFGGVNEIFGGLGLNFVATALTLWLIFGPWKRPGIGSMSGTEPFPEQLGLPTVGGERLSLWSLGLGIVAVIAVYVLLERTHVGLRLKAVGLNQRAAFLLGVPTWQYALLAFLLCGGLAGLAGAVQVTGVYHRLIPSISSGYGFLGLMIGMLIAYKAIWVAPVALFFAALNIGSIQLPIVLKLDSTLSGVLQGALVLFVLLVEGARQRYSRRAPSTMVAGPVPGTSPPDDVGAV
ncbi:MAG: ABC transporter permease [Actinomycetia bacterium]|nr:ABC transporter permease [Actinomycetes bacterium]